MATLPVQRHVVIMVMTRKVYDGGGSDPTDSTRAARTPGTSTRTDWPQTDKFQTGMFQTGMFQTGMLQTGMFQTGMFQTGKLRTVQ